MKRILKKWLKKTKISFQFFVKFKLILFFRFFFYVGIIWFSACALCIDLSVFTTTKLHIQLDCSGINKPYLISEPFQSSNFQNWQFFLSSEILFHLQVFTGIRWKYLSLVSDSLKTLHAWLWAYSSITVVKIVHLQLFGW